VTREIRSIVLRCGCWSGKVYLYCAKPSSKGGGMAFTHVEKRAAMRWVVANDA
jgi:hypothetical protein